MMKKAIRWSIGSSLHTVTVISVLVSTASAVPAIYDLGTLGGTFSAGSSVNDAGQVTGSTYPANNLPLHAFRYDGTPGAGGVMRNLGTLGGTLSYGYSINNTGQVSGVSYITDGTAYRAFRYDGTPGSGGTMRDLGTLGGTSSEGYEINDAGQVTGRAYVTGNPNAGVHAFRYDGTPGAGGVMRDLGALGGNFSVGFGINNAGQVTGSAFLTGDIVSRAFRYDGTPGVDGVMRDLGTLGGTTSAGFAINNWGQVAGYSQSPAAQIATASAMTARPAAAELCMTWVRWAGRTAAAAT